MGQWDHQVDGYTMRETHSFRERALVSEGEDVERNEESVVGQSEQSSDCPAPG